MVTVDGPENTQALFTVTLSPARLGQVVTVQYATMDGSAIANRDYLPSQGILTFAPGVSSLTIPVTVLGAMTDQSTRVFSLELTTLSRRIPKSVSPMRPRRSFTRSPLPS